MLNATARECPAIPRFVRRLPQVTGTLVLGMSATVLLGWALEIRVLQSFFPGLVTMKANTALGLGCSVLSLLLSHGRRPEQRVRRVAAFALAALVVAIGAGTLAEYVFHADLRIDQLAFRATADAALTATPGRMAAVTALLLVLLGGALLSIDYTTTRGRRPADWLALAVGAMALTALLGYLFGMIPEAGLGLSHPASSPIRRPIRRTRWRQRSAHERH